MISKQYDPKFWSPMTIEANGQAVILQLRVR